MLAFLQSRLTARLAQRLVGRSVVRPASYPTLLAGLQARTFLTTHTLQFPTSKAATAKPKAKVRAGTKRTVASKKPVRKTVRKVSAKKAAPKKKVKEAKKVAPKKITVAKELLPPKRSSNAYIYYAIESRDKYPDVRLTERAKLLGAEWRAMSDEQKEPYLEKARAELKISRIKRQEWDDQVDPITLRLINRRRKQLGKKSRVRVSRPGFKFPKTSYIRFAQDYRDSLSEAEKSSLNIKQIALDTAKKWHALPVEQKEAYKQAYRADYAVYKAAQASL